MTVPKAPNDVLALVRQLASRGRILLDFPPGSRADHLLRRMRQRGVRARDIERALREADACIAGDPSDRGVPRWKIDGPDLDDQSLAVVIELDGKSFIIVITIY